MTTSFRRIAGLLAVLALVYAAGFASLAHAAGLPMMMPMPVAMQDHAALDHAQMDRSSIDHVSMTHDGMDHASMQHDDMQADPSVPCDTGCALCKDCALCLFTGLPVISLPSVGLMFADYRPMIAALRSGIRPNLPAEPPRV